MSDSLRLRVERFAQNIGRCKTAEEVGQALHDAVYPDASVLAICGYPNRVLNGENKRYPLFYNHPDREPFLADYWREWEARDNLSYLGRYLLQVKRDVLLSEARRAMKPTRDERWLDRVLHRHRMRELLSVPSIDSVRTDFCFPKQVELDEATRRALVFAADVAMRRIY